MGPGAGAVVRCKVFNTLFNTWVKKTEKLNTHFEMGTFMFEAQENILGTWAGL
jgi:hypothetical protein